MKKKGTRIIEGQEFTGKPAAFMISRRSHYLEQLYPDGHDFKMMSEYQLKAFEFHNQHDIEYNIEELERCYKEREEYDQYLKDRSRTRNKFEIIQDVIAAGSALNFAAYLDRLKDEATINMDATLVNIIVKYKKELQEALECDRLTREWKESGLDF